MPWDAFFALISRLLELAKEALTFLLIKKSVENQQIARQKTEEVHEKNDQLDIAARPNRPLRDIFERMRRDEF